MNCLCGQFASKHVRPINLVHSLDVFAWFESGWDFILTVFTINCPDLILIHTEQLFKQVVKIFTVQNIEHFNTLYCLQKIRVNKIHNRTYLNLLQGHSTISCFSVLPLLLLDFKLDILFIHVPVAWDYAYLDTVATRTGKLHLITKIKQKCILYVKWDYYCNKK